MKSRRKTYCSQPVAVGLQHPALGIGPVGGCRGGGSGSANAHAARQEEIRTGPRLLGEEGGVDHGECVRGAEIGGSWVLIVAGARLRFKPMLVGRKGSAVGLCQQEYTIDDLRADSPFLLPHVSKCRLSQRPQLQLVWGVTGANKVATRKIKDLGLARKTLRLPF